MAARTRIGAFALPPQCATSRHQHVLKIDFKKAGHATRAPRSPICSLAPRLAARTLDPWRILHIQYEAGSTDLTTQWTLRSGARGFAEITGTRRAGTAGTVVAVVGPKLVSGVRTFTGVLVSGRLGTTAGTDVAVVGAKLGALRGALHCLNVNGRRVAQAIEQSDRSRREWWRKCRAADDGADRKDSDEELASVEAVFIVG